MPSTAVVETEWSVLLAACSLLPNPERLEKIRVLLQKPIQWPVLFDCADQHGVTFLLHERFSELGDPLPAEEMHLLQRRYRMHIHRTMFFSRELIRIFDCLDSLAVEVMPYKGVVLAEIVYGNVALRQSGDIDLLIRTRDFPRIREAIRELGYTPHLSLS